MLNSKVSGWGDPPIPGGDTGPVESTRPRLLLVEDDRALTALLADLLAEEGYDVDLARDGQSGLHHALARDYQLMVIDRGLPVLDGLQLVTRLRQRGVTCPVLLLTARGSLDDRVEGLDAGAEDYLVKPFEVPELPGRGSGRCVADTRTRRADCRWGHDAGWTWVTGGCSTTARRFRCPPASSLSYAPSPVGQRRSSPGRSC